MDVCRVRVARRPMETMHGETRDGSLFLPSSSSLSRRRVLVVESSSSRSRARRRHRAHTHTNPNPRAIGRSVGRSRSRAVVGRRRGVCLESRRVDRSIDRSDRPDDRRSRGTGRDGTGRRRARGWVSERPVGLSVGRLNDGHADGRERK